MDLQRTIAELREEYERVRDALAALERLAEGKRRGRPPKWLTKMRASDPETRQRPKEKVEEAEDTPPTSKSASV